MALGITFSAAMLTTLAVGIGVTAFGESRPDYCRRDVGDDRFDPRLSERAPLPREHPCPSTGQTTGACPDYRRDHVVPLACGRPDAVWNMWWQTVPDARAKDTWERRVWGR